MSDAEYEAAWVPCAGDCGGSGRHRLDGKPYCRGCLSMMNFRLRDPERGYLLRVGYGYTDDPKQAHIYNGLEVVDICRRMPTVQKERWKGHWSNRCRYCPGEPPKEMPDWRVLRVGDVVLSWACDAHLVKVMRELSEDKKEFVVTRLKGSDE